MKSGRLAICLAMAMLIMAPDAPSSEDDGSANPVTARLSAETRAVLIREMQAISKAMGRLHRAVVTGDHATVAEQAQSIHDSFVLSQALSDAQRKEIATKLPEAFVQRDRTFHELAARLAEAGKQERPRLQRFWLQEMTRACQGCHAGYASGRFPGLAGPEGG